MAFLRSIKLPRPVLWTFKLIYDTVDRLLDGGGDRSAAMAYYAVQAIFPGLFFAVSLSLLVSSTGTFDNAIAKAVAHGLDPSIAKQIKTTIDNASERAHAAAGFAAVFAGFLSLLSASGWFGAVGRAIAPDSRQRKHHAVGFITGRARNARWTLVLIVLIVGAITALTLGGSVANTVFGWVGFPAGAPLAWTILRIPIVAAAMITAYLIVYRKAPDWQNPPRLRRLVPGAILGTIGWVLATIGFLYYVNNLSNLGATYGAFATPIVLLLWLYVSGMCALLGAAFNAELALRHPDRDTHSLVPPYDPHLVQKVREEDEGRVEDEARAEDRVREQDAAGEAALASAEGEARAEAGEDDPRAEPRPPVEH
jgi:membrane protein